MITYEEALEAIEKFARSRGMGMLGLAHHKPDPKAIATHCIQNVLNRVNERGGATKYGWTFHHRVNPDFGDYLFATHHAVWHNPSGILDDITPFHAEVKHHPMTELGDVLFLLDENAQPFLVNQAAIPLPLIYFPIKKDPKILEYLKSLTEQEIEYYRTNFGIDLDSI